MFQKDKKESWIGVIIACIILGAMGGVISALIGFPAGSSAFLGVCLALILGNVLGRKINHFLRNQFKELKETFKQN